MKNINLNLELKLSDALFLLLKDHPYSKITINDLTKKVNISRTTFYLCFENKDDLLHFSCERYFIPFFESLQTTFFLEKDNFIQHTKNGLEKIKPNLSLLPTILDLKELDFNPSQVILTAVQKRIKEILNHSDLNTSDLKYDYFAHLFSACLLETQLWWSQHLDEITSQNIADLIYTSCYQGLNLLLKY